MKRNQQHKMARPDVLEAVRLMLLASVRSGGGLLGRNGVAADTSDFQKYKSQQDTGNCCPQNDMGNSEKPADVLRGLH